MVKIGIIVEGVCEKIVLDADAFQSFLLLNNLELADEIININGKSKLKPDAPEIRSSINILREQGAEKIIILRDMDEEPSFSAVKSEVITEKDITVCIAVKELEAWFLADSYTMAILFGLNTFYFEKPEEPYNPSAIISQLSIEHTGRGTGWERTGGKIKFANRMKNKGFTIEKAAQHPNCPSAHYFLTKLQTLASAN